MSYEIGPNKGKPGLAAYDWTPPNGNLYGQNPLKEWGWHLLALAAACAALALRSAVTSQPRMTRDCLD
jgi:hypothetical protein